MKDTSIIVPWEDENKDQKEGNKRLRWNLVFNLLLWTVIPLPIWLPFVTPSMALNILILIQITFMMCWLVVSALAWTNYFKLRLARNKDFTGGSKNEHLIVISTYKEPVSLLISTIESIETQALAKTKINLTLSFEERTPQLNEKIQILKILPLLLGL